MAKSNVPSNDTPKNNVSEITTPQARAIVNERDVSVDGRFAIRAGTPIGQALQLASCFLATAIPIASDAAEVASAVPNEGTESWAAVYLIEAAKTSIDSVLEAMHEQARKLHEATA